LIHSPFLIDKTRPAIIRNNAAFAVWLRVLQLFNNVSHHEFVTKLIMQKIVCAVHLHHPAYAKATAGEAKKETRGELIRSPSFTLKRFLPFFHMASNR
jgi:hypothetical protein